MDDDERFDEDPNFPCPFVIMTDSDDTGRVWQELCRQETDHIDIKDGRWYCEAHYALEEETW
jgi:hypothetical protein